MCCIPGGLTSMSQLVGLYEETCAFGLSRGFVHGMGSRNENGVDASRASSSECAPRRLSGTMVKSGYLTRVPIMRMRSPTAPISSQFSKRVCRSSHAWRVSRICVSQRSGLAAGAERGKGTPRGGRCPCGSAG